MKFVKEYLTQLICGAVTLLLLVWAFVPIPYAVPSLREELTTQMKERYSRTDKIKGYIKEPLKLPGLSDKSGIPPQVWIDAKDRLIKNIQEQQRQVETLARNSNENGRVSRGVPIIPLPTENNKVGKAAPGFLPVTNKAMDFKPDYGALFRVWRYWLARNELKETDDDTIALPPKAEKIKADWEARNKTTAGAAGVSAYSVSQQSQEFMAYQKKQLMNHAAGLRMYVEQYAFQRRDWLDKDRQPSPAEIFEAFVDSWLQSDVVKAIVLTNNQALANFLKDDQHVGKAAVKRLTRIVVGNNARNRYLNATTPGGAVGTPALGNDAIGDLFFTAANANSPGGAVARTLTPVSVADGNAGRATGTRGGLKLPDTPNTTNYELGMTGRFAGKTYDVVYMSVVMDIDPAYLVKFIDNLYKQNMGYTITNLQQRAIDPLDRASNGYLYDSQTVEVEMLIECVFFRSWTTPLIPDEIKNKQLGGS
jgi:hypothetical protein